MKTKLYYLAVLLLALGLSTSAKIKDGQVLSGNSQTDLGNYSIVKSEVPVVVDDQELSTYDVIYENASKPVRIAVLAEKKSTTFLIYCNEVEVQYVSQKGLFGVEKMDKKYRKLASVNADAKLDVPNYYAQKVITRNPKTEKELLGLIACYFPDLVEKQYQAQL
jgi:hypothetical protein